MYAAAASCPLRLFPIGDILSPWSSALGAASCLLHSRRSGLLPAAAFLIGDIVSP